MHIWEALEGNLKGVIECKSDIQGGRMKEDRVTAKNSTKNKHFNSIAISPNGEFIIGGGNSKNIFLYDLRHKLLLKRFVVTQNRSLDGVLHILNSKNVKGEIGVAEDELDVESDIEEDMWDNRNREDQNLPGAQKGNASEKIKRKVKLAVKVKNVKFSPDGSSFACATTEGLLVFSLKNDSIFNPVDIDENVSIDSIIDQVK